MVEEDRQAIHDLTRMAFLYVQRGALGKAAELMELAQQIENRVNRDSRAQTLPRERQPTK